MGCLAGHQISRPKPYAQRGVRACHDRSNRQSGVTAALATAQDAGSISEAERLSRHLTMGANEPAAPARLLQVGGAGGVVGKKSLKLWKRLWEPKIATLVNIDEHARTLALVAVGCNRIGKRRSSCPLATSCIVACRPHGRLGCAGLIRPILRGGIPAPAVTLPARVRSGNHRPNRPNYPSRCLANPKRCIGHSRGGSCGAARGAHPSSSQLAWSVGSSWWTSSARPPWRLA